MLNLTNDINVINAYFNFSQMLTKLTFSLPLLLVEEIMASLKVKQEAQQAAAVPAKTEEIPSESASQADSGIHKDPGCKEDTVSQGRSG